MSLPVLIVVILIGILAVMYFLRYIYLLLRIVYYKRKGNLTVANWFVSKYRYEVEGKPYYKRVLSLSKTKQRNIVVYYSEKKPRICYSLSFL